MDNKILREITPGAVAAATGVIILMYKDPVQALGVITCFGGVFWIGYAVLTNILDRLGMSINDFFF
ncbi:MAG: hypothetical protein ABEK50_15775 [bacterium]